MQIESAPENENFPYFTVRSTLLQEEQLNLK